MVVEERTGEEVVEEVVEPGARGWCGGEGFRVVLDEPEEMPEREAGEDGCGGGGAARRTGEEWTAVVLLLPGTPPLPAVVVG